MLHEYRDLISELKGKDAHFDKLFEHHNELDKQIKNIEENQISTLSNIEISTLKKEKLRIKDELKKYLENYKK
ncbi:MULTISPECIES: YdcH family protein [Campylobacter]|uniref:YdcH family protein n=1 Tax=Campylobacter TaxID=194 RepID=UPI001EC908E9|nr:YdcH family protein [Campylobacter sp. W0014]